MAVILVAQVTITIVFAVKEAPAQVGGLDSWFRCSNAYHPRLLPHLPRPGRPHGPRPPGFDPLPYLPTAAAAEN